MTPERLKEIREMERPDCGDNSCMFGGRRGGGMRTNGGCQCMDKLSIVKWTPVEKYAARAARVIPELLAEVDRLKAVNDDLFKNNDGIHMQNTRLRAWASAWKLSARKHHQQVVCYMTDQATKLSAENVRLVGYLQRIKAHGCCVMHNDERCPGCAADEALKGRKEG